MEQGEYLLINWRVLQRFCFLFSFLVWFVCFLSIVSCV